MAVEIEEFLTWPWIGSGHTAYRRRRASLIDLSLPGGTLNPTLLLPTYQISSESEKRFVDGRTYGLMDIWPMLLGRLFGVDLNMSGFPLMTFQHHKHQKIRPTVLPLTTFYVVLIRKHGLENVTRNIFCWFIIIINAGKLNCKNLSIIDLVFQEHTSQIQDFQHLSPISGIFRSWKIQTQISGPWEPCMLTYTALSLKITAQRKGKENCFNKQYNMFYSDK